MKRIICAVLTIVLLLGVFVPETFAATSKDHRKIVAKVEKANEKIEKLIKEAIKDVEQVSRSKKSQIKIEKEIKEIINDLIKDTNKVAHKMIKQAANQGVLVICEYVEVNIGGHKVMIDPLRVVGL